MSPKKKGKREATGPHFSLELHHQYNRKELPPLSGISSWQSIVKLNLIRRCPDPALHRRLLEIHRYLLR